VAVAGPAVDVATGLVVHGVIADQSEVLLDEGQSQGEAAGSGARRILYPNTLLMAAAWTLGYRWRYRLCISGLM